MFVLQTYGATCYTLLVGSARFEGCCACNALLCYFCSKRPGPRKYAPPKAEAKKKTATVFSQTHLVPSKAAQLSHGFYAPPSALVEDVHEISNQFVNAYYTRTDPRSLLQLLRTAHCSSIHTQRTTADTNRKHHDICP